MKEHFEGAAPVPENNRDKQPEEKKIGRRRFLKDLGRAALGVGSSLYMLDKIAKNHSEREKENKEHERSGEGEIIEKSQDNNQLHIESYHKVVVRFEGNEKSIIFPEQDFNTFNVGDKVPIIFDDRNKENWGIKADQYGHISKEKE